MAFLLNKFSYIKVSVWGRIPVLSVVCRFPVSLSAGPAAGFLLCAQPPLSGSSPHHSSTWYLKTHTHQNNNSIQLHNNLWEKKKKTANSHVPSPTISVASCAAFCSNRSFICLMLNFSVSASWSFISSSGDVRQARHLNRQFPFESI